MKMKKIHHSEFIEIEFDEEQSLFDFKFYDLEEWSDEEFKEELEIQAKLSETYHPKYFLFHSQEFNFTITPTMQEWIDQTIFPRYVKAGVKKFAYIFSSDTIAQLSIEQAMEEEIGSQAFKTMYFSHADEAKKWLGVK